MTQAHEVAKKESQSGQ